MIKFFICDTNKNKNNKYFHEFTVSGFPVIALVLSTSSYPSCSFSDLAICVLAISLLFLSWYSLFALSYRHGYLIHSAISGEFSFYSKLRDFGLFRVFLSAILITSVPYACSFLKILIDIGRLLWKCRPDSTKICCTATDFLNRTDFVFTNRP